MVDPFLGQITIYAFNFAPQGWALCHGQLLPISQNTALFALLGTTFGGDGKSTFALPDLQGRVPIGVGQGLGLTEYVVGQEDGSETIVLNTSEMASHAHAFDSSAMQGTLRCYDGRGNQRDATGNVPAVESAGVTAAFSDAAPLTSNLASGAVAVTGALALTPTGGGQPHANLQPFLVLNYCIAMSGIFPSRS